MLDYKTSLYLRNVVKTTGKPQSHLSIFLAAPDRSCILDQQFLATRHPHSSGGTDVVCGYSARGAIPRDPLPVGLLGL
jgi:hypothetical protein